MADVPVDLDRPVTYRDFNALVQLFTEEKVIAAAERKERGEEKAKADADRKEFREFMKTTKEFMEKANEDRDRAEKEKKDKKDKKEKAQNDENDRKEKENNKAEQERADMKKMWEEGRVLEYMLIVLKNNQGTHPYPKLVVHVKVE
jgi:hypothetical protein